MSRPDNPQDRTVLERIDVILDDYARWLASHRRCGR